MDAEPTLITPIRDLLPEFRELPGSVPSAAQPALAPGFPSLPGVVSAGVPSPLPVTRSLVGVVPRWRSGCYLARFEPDPGSVPLIPWPKAEGAFRIESPDVGTLVATGDLYRVEAFAAFDDVFGVLPATTGDSQGVAVLPVFPRDRYHAYLRIMPDERDAAQRGGWAVGCAVHRIRDAGFQTWDPPDQVTLFPRLGGGEDSPSAGGQAVAPVADLSFDVLDASDTCLGRLDLHWLSPFFREAVVEIDAEEGLPTPMDNGSGETWATVFARAGWRVRVETGRLEVPTPPSGRWTLAELHDALLRSRTESDLDAEWRYHVSVVRHFADAESPLGIAFDHESMDLNGVPREGVAVNAGARLPSEARYGDYAGALVHERPDLLFHVSVHEVAHAMGLYHNHVGFGLTEQIEALAGDSPFRRLSPDDLEPRFVADDVFRLRHLPDIQVRPGGSDFETLGLVENRAAAMDQVAGLHLPKSRAELEGGMDLELEVVQAELPTGSPLRVNFHVVNRGDRPLSVPPRLSLATPFVRGWVIGPDGVENEFRSLFKAVWAEGSMRLLPAGRLAGSMTLLRGRRGALLARPGRHTLWVEVGWSGQGRHWGVRRRLRFEVAPLRGASEDRASRRLVGTPETLGYLVLGRGSSFRAGELAVDHALEASGLRPHFAFIKAKALAAAGADRPADWTRVRELLGAEDLWQVLNRRERMKAEHLLKCAEAGFAGGAAGTTPA
jgi:hypothetical protein